MSTCLTLSTTKGGTDLGTLVVPFDQTCHPLYKWHMDMNKQQVEIERPCDVTLHAAAFYSGER